MIAKKSSETAKHLSLVLGQPFHLYSIPNPFWMLPLWLCLTQLCWIPDIPNLRSLSYWQIRVKRWLHWPIMEKQLRHPCLRIPELIQSNIQNNKELKPTSGISNFMKNSCKRNSQQMESLTLPTSRTLSNVSLSVGGGGVFYPPLLDQQ